MQGGCRRIRECVRLKANEFEKVTADEHRLYQSVGAWTPARSGGGRSFGVSDRWVKLKSWWTGTWWRRREQSCYWLTGTGQGVKHNLPCRCAYVWPLWQRPALCLAFEGENTSCWSSMVQRTADSSRVNPLSFKSWDHNSDKCFLTETWDIEKMQKKQKEIQLQKIKKNKCYCLQKRNGSFILMHTPFSCFACIPFPLCNRCRGRKLGRKNPN